MSVKIKGIDMPIACDGCFAEIKREGSYVCLFTKRSTVDNDVNCNNRLANRRHKLCPLEEE